MIRTVRIPRLTMNRIGQTTETISYLASTCTQVDPATGLCIGDVLLGDATNPLPADPGAGAALSDYAAGQRAAAAAAALQQSGVSQPASFAIAQSLMAGNIPSPLPGLGVTFSDPFRKFLLIGTAVVAGLILLDDRKASRR